MPLAASSRATEDRPSLAAATDALWIASATLLAGVALLLLLRRLAGAFAVPLPPLGMAAAGVAAAALTAAVRLGWRRRGVDRLALVAPWFAETVATVCLVMCALALSVAGAAPLGYALLWMPVVAEEALAWHTLARRGQLFRPTATAGGNSVADSIGNGVASSSEKEAVADSGDGDACAPIGLDAPPDETVLQQLARRVTAAGAEEISGWLRMPLLPGQQGGSLHVAFCPPLAAPPEVEVEQADGPAARIKVAQAQAYGARLDVKLAVPAAEATSLLVQFFARAPT